MVVYACKLLLNSWDFRQPSAQALAVCADRLLIRPVLGLGRGMLKEDKAPINKVDSSRVTGMMV